MITNETLRLIESRRSHRAYAETPLTEEQLDALLRAALASPSAVNYQPWHFTVVRDKELLSAMNTEARKNFLDREGIEKRSRFQDPAFDVFYHAPCVIFIFADPSYGMSRIDCGIAAENMVLAAESMGLGSVILGLPRDAFTSEKKEDFISQLKMPEGYEFAVAVAFGTPTDTKPAHTLRENTVTIL